MSIKRLHYFDHQFLVEADFTGEQQYHLNMRRRLNRLLHTFGIGEGLEVAKSSNKTVTVRPGTAIDRSGQEMIVETDQVVDLSNTAQFSAGAIVYITIAYSEHTSDSVTATGVTGDTRSTELPALAASTTVPSTDGSVVWLAKFSMDASGNVPGNINDLFDGGARQVVGPKGERAPSSINGVRNAGGNIDLVQANAVTIAPDPANNRIAIGESHSARTDNPHATTAAQVGALVSVKGLANAGGNVDVVAANAVTVAADPVNKVITVGETHSARTDNPHATTAAQVGALPSAGGTLGGNLQVNGNIGVTGTVDTRKVSADGAKLDTHVAIVAGNPHGTTAAQVGALVSVKGIANPGGNVDVVAATNTAVTVAADSVNKVITVGETHSARTDNPHATTAAQVGALPSAGGTLGGNLQVTGNIGLTGTVDTRKVSADGTKLDTHVGTFGNPHGTTAAQVGALPTSGGGIIGGVTVGTAASPIVARLADPNIGTAQNAFGMDTTKNQAVFISGQTNPNVGFGTKAALFIWPVIDACVALFISAASNADTLSCAGTARFTGTKIGYVSDTFVNGSGKVLYTGDIVKLKSDGNIRFHGDNNRIPIPEVILSDTADDPLVIGIVAQEATPAADAPDRRTDPADPTSIPDGGELFVVTLGTFAHCKVDASESPIAVGDLLTSSKNPGYARKAKNPKIGSIIGKALEPLEEGTGYIAVFVNIQ